uniref:Dehydrogenase/reductase (SDR family) member 9 n=1 Tax=Amphilophus citrinellus TaxID=61819 RepID=A0A3Q0SJH9_AMPCI
MYLYLLGLVVLYYLYRWVRELPRVSDKNNRYVYITGCDSGFGNLLAQHLDKQGFRVIASCFTERGEEELKKSCSSNLITTHLDVRSQDSIAKVRRDHAPLYINRVCVERVVFFKLLGTHISEDLTWTANTAALVKKAQGRVVNVASVFGRISAIGGPYTVSKFGVEAFSDSIRINMAPFGVKVLCIEPGFFKTQMASSEVVCNNIKMLWEKLPQEVRDDYGSEYLQKTLALLTDKIAKLGDADLMKVVHCMEHAVAAVRRRTRYSPGWDAKLFRLPLSYMPTCVSDYILQMEAIPIAKQIE